MDYKGQRLSELMYYWIIIVFGVIAWIIGFFQADFQTTVIGWGIGLALATLLCVPDWPWFNRHPIRWLDHIPGAEPASISKTGGGGSKNSSQKKKKKNKSN
uniref:Signal peptidase complex subunit 1 n=1 Tax=Pinguiococcus pyrenoidosus TaxID=172671 RepID=A0A7R9UF33_9STRA|mmetsp:Transcript_8443/g.31810  ORF Transcript_8443/g.31810 Transcript_8443/m.31810 type:complete len:101 (+) Transcript_8443:129-431(+)